MKIAKNIPFFNCRAHSYLVIRCIAAGLGVVCLLMVVACQMGFEDAWVQEEQAVYLTDAQGNKIKTWNRGDQFENGSQTEGLQCVREASTLKCGLLDDKGAWRVPPEFDHIDSGFVNGATSACKEGKWGILDAQGNWLINPEYVYAKPFSLNGFAEVYLRNRIEVNYIDTEGNLALPSYLQRTTFGNNNLAVAQDADTRLYGYINREGEWSIPARYSYAKEFGEATCAFAQDAATGLFGIVNSQGDWASAPSFSFSMVGRFTEEGLAFATDKETGLSGCMNTQGEWVLAPQFLYNESFVNGYACVQDNETKKWGVLTSKGTWAIEPQYCGMLRLSGSSWIAKDSATGLYGFVDSDNCWIVEPRYTYALTSGSGIAKVKEQAPRPLGERLVSSFERMLA